MLDFDGTRKSRRRDAILAGGILLISLFLLAMPEEYQRPIRGTLRASILRPFLATQAQIAQRRSRSEDISVLRAQRDSLAAIVAAQATLAEENRQLRAALELQGRLAADFVPAGVLRVGLTSAESTFIIDAGTADGVYVGSPIFTADGLLGLVREVDENSAQAIDWSHPDFAVGAMSADGDAYGIVVPRRGEYREADLLALTGTAFQIDVRPGRRVVTSGRGGVVPRGIFLGTVLGIEEADTGWRKSYLLRPGVRLEAVTHVLVGIRPGQADLSDVFNVTAPRDTSADTTAGGGN
ncbi:MAG TPA: rod shape-determining protein MreC [Longimicrobiales bacterium]